MHLRFGPGIRAEPLSLPSSRCASETPPTTSTEVPMRSSILWEACHSFSETRSEPRNPAVQLYLIWDERTRMTRDLWLSRTSWYLNHDDLCIGNTRHHLETQPDLNGRSIHSSGSSRSCPTDYRR